VELLHRRPQQARAHPCQIRARASSTLQNSRSLSARTWSSTSASVGIGHQPRTLKALPLALPRIRSFGSASTRAWMAPVSVGQKQERGLSHPLVRWLFIRLAEPASTRGPARSSSGPELALSTTKGCGGRLRDRLVAADHRIGTGALFHRIAVPAAGAGIVTKRHFCSGSR
jgi:hypothetical protein